MVKLVTIVCILERKILYKLISKMVKELQDMLFIYEIPRAEKV